MVYIIKNTCNKYPRDVPDIQIQLAGYPTIFALVLVQQKY